MNKSVRSLRPVCVAPLVGAALWLACSALTGAREPWDSPLYWLLVFPLAVATAVYLARRHPHHSWLWSLLVFEGQLLGQWVKSGELGNLWPLGMLVLAVLSLPGGAMATYVARRAEAE